MGRYRSRSPSRSPPRGKHYDDPRDRHRRYDRFRDDAPTGLLVRNIALDARPEDLRAPFERFGPIKDVYLPKNYYTGEPRGFGFVKFCDPNDAAEAKDRMDRQIIGGREISIVFAEENRKTPQEMRRSTRMSDRYTVGSSRRRSPRRSPRKSPRRSPRRSPWHRHRSYSRSLSPPPRRDSRDRYRSSRDDKYYSPPRSGSPARDMTKHRPSDRSPSPKRSGRSRSRSHSRQADHHSPSMGINGHGPSRSRSYSPR